MKNVRLFLVLLFAAMMVSGNVYAAPANGTVNPYTLYVQGMQDKDKNTDVYVTVDVNANGFTPPSSSKKVQLKSFDTSGELRWTKNEQNVALQTRSGTTSEAVFRYTDMSRGQPIQSQALIQNGQTTNTKVLNANGNVYLRPDLTVVSVSSSAQFVSTTQGTANISGSTQTTTTTTTTNKARVGSVVNITAHIQEKNGDLGGKATVRLKNGNDVWDTATNVSVAPGGVVDAVFSHKFDQVGTYNLTVSVDNVTPGDYDNSNNTGNITIEITNAIDPAYFYAGYGHGQYNYDSHWRSSYGAGDYFYANRWEGLYAGIYVYDRAFNFPVDKVTVDIKVDGNPLISHTVTNVGSQYQDPSCSIWSWSSVPVGDQEYMYVSTSKGGTCWGWTYGKYASAHYSKYASDQVYFSSWHDTYWGSYSYNYSYAYHYGTFLNLAPQSRIDIRMVAEDAGITPFGGNLGTLVAGRGYNYSYSYPWSYSGSDWQSWGQYAYSYMADWISGITTP